MTMWRLLVFVSLLIIPEVDTVEVNGAGASFPADVYSSWLPAYKAYRARFKQVNMRYESIGSGGGKSRIKGEKEPEVEYAGSDSLLSESDYEKFPDLQMFPSMAGPIVLAFNLPGIENLNLKMKHVAGIYSGKIKWWNDPELLEINTEINLPERQIFVVARREKSGTTEIFTETLSAASEEWAREYGTFNAGLDPDDKPYHWNASVVSLYGQTNRGVSGFILSTRYSVGYIVLSDAKSAKLTYARLQNAAGVLVDASVETVQNAMADFAGEFTERMTLSLANPTGRASYPISGYTYIIVKKTTMANCESAVELVRYIEWFYTNSIPRKECEQKYMVPLSEAVYNLVMNRVVKQMSCKGLNIYDLVLDEIEDEVLSLQTWRLPVYISVPLLVISFIILLLFLVKNQILLHREMLRDEWRIPSKDIKLGLFSKSVANFGSSKSNNKIYPSVGSFSHSSKEPLYVGNLSIGQWKKNSIALDKCQFLNTNYKLPFRTRKTLLWMRNYIQHTNVVVFYGITDFDSVYSSVCEFCPKGSLYDLLRNIKVNINNDMKYIITSDIVKGMKYLHKNKICHGTLSSKCCYLDSSFRVKIGNWQNYRLAHQMKETIISKDVLNANDWNMLEFWTAPEILRLSVEPTERSDVYSFSILMQEIFSRESPYAEHNDSQDPNGILQAVLSMCLRPVFTPDTPVPAREIMERCWEMDPFGRPPFGQIYQTVSSVCPSNMTLIDCMMNALEEYVEVIEDKLQEMKMYTVSTEMPVKITNNWLPTEIQSAISTKPFAESFDSATVMVSVLHGFEDLVTDNSASDIASFLTNVYASLDNVLTEFAVTRFDCFADTYMVVSGLPTRRNDHAVIMSKLALSFLVLAKTFILKAFSDTPIQMKVGVCSGPGMAGVLQPELLPKYTVFGKTVLTSQVLAAQTPPMTIHLAESTASLINTSRDFTIIPAPENPILNIKRSYWLTGSRFTNNTFPPP